MKRYFCSHDKYPKLSCYYQLLAGLFLACLHFEELIDLENNQKSFRLRLEFSTPDFLNFLSNFLPVPSKITKIHRNNLCFYEWSLSQNKPEKLKLKNPNPLHLLIEKEDSILFVLKMISVPTYPGLLPNTEQEFLQFAKNYLNFIGASQEEIKKFPWPFETDPFYFQSLRVYPTISIFDRDYLERPPQIEAWFASYLSPFLSMGFEFQESEKDTKIIPYLKIQESPLHKIFDKDSEQWFFLETVYHLPFRENILGKGKKEMILKAENKIDRNKPLDSDFDYFLQFLVRAYSKLQNPSKQSFIPLPQHKELKIFAKLVDKLIGSQKITPALLKACKDFNQKT